MRVVPLRCYRFTRPISNEDLIAALEATLAYGAVRLNVCSQEFLWVHAQTVRLLLLRQDDFFAWIPRSVEADVYRPQHDWWQPMRLRGLAPLRL